MYKQQLLKDVYQGWPGLKDQKTEISGWIRTSRDSKNFGFIELNDGTCFNNIQVVYDKDLPNFEEIKKLGISSALTVRGVLVEAEKAKQDFELRAEEIVIEGKSADDYPLQKKRHTFEYLRTIAHLRPRSNTFSAVFRVRSEVSLAIHNFFAGRGFVYTHTPIISSSDAEGSAEMFRITTLDLNNLPMKDGKVDDHEDFFGRPISLSGSGQLQGETFAQAFRNIYTFGPTFRAENSNTKRHAAEFWQIEPEMAFCDLEQNMKVAEDMIKYIINHVFETCPAELDFFDSRISKGLKDRLDLVRTSDFEVVTYDRAIEILKESGEKFEFKVEWGLDLQTEHEKYLTDIVYKKPVFVRDYPRDIKSFYMRLNEDGRTVAAMDLLVPGIGEIIGGSQREERYEYLHKRMEELGLDEDIYYWFLDLRKYGTTKHSGFGLGLERMIMYITGMDNIRDVLPFPRTVGTADF